jgi:iron only hydrogenase large subunit-like protein
MSSVFLADVDDYLSPSTACVNPAFATGNGDSTTTTAVAASTATTTNAVTAAGSAPDQQSKTNQGDDDNNNASEGVVRRRPRYPVVRRGGGRGGAAAASIASTNSNSSNGNNKVTASIVDCLACSGCVTTAETVLLKEHSVDKFREMLVGARRRSRGRRTTTTRNNDSSSIDNVGSTMEVEEEEEDQSNSEDSARVVVTLSIASAAELLRLLRRDNSNYNSISGSTITTATNLPLTLQHRKLASLLCRQLIVDAVLDGRLALEWSLQQSAVEFCGRYQHQHQHHQPTDHMSTLVSSSCPATVCYVEKTCPSAVPHLSRVVSPLGCARAYLSSGPHVHHVAIMPCHDKKLEATRPTSSSSSTGSGDGNTTNTNKSSNNQNVLVLTTSDCWQLLLESIDADDDEDRAELRLPAREDRLRRMFESVPPSDVDRVESPQDFEPRRQGIVSNSWITSDAGDDDNNNGRHTRGTAPSSSLLYTSGGYADYIFRFAAHRMFGTSIPHVEWNAVSANNALALSSSSSPAAAGDPAASSASSSIRSRPVNTEGRPTTASARVAAARREILEATLYRHEYRRCSSSESVSAESVVVEYSQDEHPTRAAASEGLSVSTSSLLQVSTTPVLRFAMAHGLQVMQRAISNAGSSESASSRYHYVEAMACPSGCLNGGGQVLVPSASSSSHQQDGRREPPSEVKARVESASRNLRRPPRPPSFQDLPNPSLLQHPSSYRENLLNEQLQTSFHAVQPLQLQYGAARGMAVKDIQW